MLYRFGDCELDAQRSELRCKGIRVALEPRPFALLTYLVQHRGRLVTKEELFETLWPRATVTENSLARAVSLVRKAIGDGSRSTVRTVSRRGFRFEAEVEEARPEDTGASAPEGEGGLLGREAELASLREAWARAVGGAGQVVLIEGEAGIGKTSLAAAFADEVEDGRVARGRSVHREGVPAFWLWAQVYRELGGRADLAAVATGAGAKLSHLWSLVPGGRGEGDDALVGSPAEQRFFFFDTATQVLRTLSEEQPHAIVLEDLHWSSRPSLLLLEHLAAEIADQRVLIVVTIREEPRDAEHPVERTRELLQSFEHTHRIALSGWSAPDARRWLRRATGRDIPDPVANGLFDLTQGNPLFLRHALHLLEADAETPSRPEWNPRLRVDRLPDQSREILRRRLESLSAEGLDLLRHAAVAGRHFSVAVLAEANRRSPEQTLDLLDDAATLGIVEAGEDAGSFDFVHPLFRELLYDEFPLGQRARAHASIAEAIERLKLDRDDRVLSELAHHFHHALPLCDPNRAFQAALASAERAQAGFAYELVAEHYAQALAAVDAGAEADADDRLELMLSRGEALRSSGERTRRRDVLRSALDQARAQAAGEPFLRAAIAFCDISEWGPRDDDGRRILYESLEIAGPDASPPKARLLTRLAHLDRLDRRVSEPIAREALAMANRFDDPTPIVEASYILHLILEGPDSYEERCELVRAMEQHARSAEDRDPAFIALLDLAADALMHGDREQSRSLAERAVLLGGPKPHRSLEWHRRVHEDGLLLMEGRFEEAAASIRDTLVVGRLIEHPYAVPMFLAQGFYRARDRGELLAWSEDLGRWSPQANPQSDSHLLSKAVFAYLAIALGGPTARDPYDAAIAEITAADAGIDWLGAAGRNDAALPRTARSRTGRSPLRPPRGLPRPTRGGPDHDSLRGARPALPRVVGRRAGTLRARGRAFRTGAGSLRRPGRAASRGADSLGVRPPPGAPPQPRTTRRRPGPRRRSPCYRPSNARNHSRMPTAPAFLMVF